MTIINASCIVLLWHLHNISVNEVDPICCGSVMACVTLPGVQVDYPERAEYHRVLDLQVFACNALSDACHVCQFCLSCVQTMSTKIQVLLILFVQFIQ